MPLYVGQSAPLVSPDVVLQHTSVGRASATWVAPDGVEWPLEVADERYTLNAVAGLGIAPVSLVSDPYSRGGVRVRHRQPQPRSITWPVLVVGGTQDEFVSRWRALGNAFALTQRLGPGRLVIRRPDGSGRQISAEYEAGFDGEPGYGWVDDTAVVGLFCPDPYWEDLASRTEIREYGAGVDFQAPFPSVSSAQVLGATKITNTGDVEAWPQWLITGPADAVVATNDSTGESFTITHALADATEEIRVDTTIGAVRGPGDINLSSALDWPGAVLWSLQPGVNSVTFAVTGSGAGTSIALTWTPRYRLA